MIHNPMLTEVKKPEAQAEKKPVVHPATSVTNPQPAAKPAEPKLHTPAPKPQVAKPAVPEHLEKIIKDMDREQKDSLVTLACEDINAETKKLEVEIQNTMQTNEKMEMILSVKLAELINFWTNNSGKENNGTIKVLLDLMAEVEGLKSLNNAVVQELKSISTFEEGDRLSFLPKGASKGIKEEYANHAKKTEDLLFQIRKETKLEELMIKANSISNVKDSLERAYQIRLEQMENQFAKINKLGRELVKENEKLVKQVQKLDSTVADVNDRIDIEFNIPTSSRHKKNIKELEADRVQALLKINSVQREQNRLHIKLQEARIKSAL